MKYMGLNDVRESYLKFFESKGHLRLPSFSLVPKNDKSLLLINAGMAPLKPYFTGLKVPPRNRVTTCQKCIRTGDIENVGKTSRHGTFFEMLGNFSFGDYFKEEVIPWAWEFVTEVLQIPQEKLFVTIYENDDEAYKIWTEKTNVNPKKIFRLGKEDNFWEIGEGPCGPCSEIHFNKENVDVNTVEEFIKASDEDKIIEFWNLVFTQYDKDSNGNYNKLKNPNIDTGMGLERIATIMQEVDNIFEIDTIKSISEEVCKIANVSYGKEDKNDVSIRIISDHIRSIAFMISDGILPSNEGRGYVLRRLLRRAERHGKLLGINEMFLYELCDKVIENSKYAYPELKEKEEYIKKVIRLEEERFSETIDSGMEILKSYIKEAKKLNKNVLEGEKAFKLYDTYGFPYELTEEILEDEGLALDKEGFNKEMELQRERARNARQQTNYMGTENNIANEIPKEINTNFVGYDNTEYKSKVSLLIKEDKFVDSLDKEGIIITSETPFYAEMGGQVGDKGIIYNDNFKAEVVDCKNNVSGKIMHFVKVLEGKASKGEEVILKVDEENREKICKNHTATHMLHSALREVLGEHVQQSGSLVNSNRLRFDFTHFASMTEEEVKKVEKIINSKIMKVYSLETKIMTIEEAKQSGATALFDDKYSNQVRVVSISDFSKELCGGTHVKNIGQIGLFKILSESGVASGIRRIEAVTGEAAIEYVEKNQELIKSIEDVLKTNSKDIINKINLQNSELKDKEKEIEQLKKKIAGGSKEEILDNVKEVNGIKIALGEVKDLDANSLRDLADTIKDSIGSGLVILASNNKDKVQFVAMCTKDVLNKGIHCGKIIKEVSKIAEGGGGGKPDMAQAGGKNPQKIKEALSEVQNIVNKL